ncbi:flavodoxin domain-containing protein [Lactiplantibacillus herbarum]|uniref:flavodoxin domain-containing protein n=1 Tax=Lactiplantibacillus herbarum TaxID=1670446 RepID=UPI00064F567F|nr:flavodoxin domain-containing protein [Lactiplantibacillus herbarum]
MMNRIAVIYQSNYGATRQYAEWIAAELDADLFERKMVTKALLKTYAMIIYGGGLYASGIIGSELVANNPCNHLIVFTVGLADPTQTDYTQIMHRAFRTEARQPQQVFHFRGAIDYAKLGVVHRNLMRLLKTVIASKNQTELTPENQAFLATYGRQVDFKDRATIQPLVAYVRELGMA